MTTTRPQFVLFLVFTLFDVTNAEMTCLSDGQLAAIVFGCIFGTLIVGSVLAAILYCLKLRRDKAFIKAGAKVLGEDNATYLNPIFNTDDEKRNSVFVLNTDETNQAVRRNSSAATAIAAKKAKLSEQSSLDTNPKYTRRRRSTLFHGLLSKRIAHSISSALDAIQSNENLSTLNEYMRVPLQSSDRNGLGFTVHGNMRDGIFIKDILPRGPANQSAQIHVGDRLVSIAISFERMVFEDALTILSYASPYQVILELQKQPQHTKSKDDISQKDTSAIDSSNVETCRKPTIHPLFTRSQSSDELNIKNDQVIVNKQYPKKIDARRTKSVQEMGASTNLTLQPVTNDVITMKDLQYNQQQDDETQSETADQTDVEVAIFSKSSEVTEAAINNIEDKSEAEFEERDPDILTNSDDQIPDPYKDLSFEERMQVLRLSYEDQMMSRSTPDLAEPMGLSLPPQSITPDHPKITRFDSAPPTALTYAQHTYDIDCQQTNHTQIELTLTSNTTEQICSESKNAKSDRSTDSDYPISMQSSPTQDEFSSQEVVIEVPEIAAQFQDSPVVLHTILNRRKSSVRDDEDIVDHAKILRDKKAALKESMAGSNWLRHEGEEPGVNELIGVVAPMNNDSESSIDDDANGAMMTSPSSCSSNDADMNRYKSEKKTYNLRSTKSMPGAPERSESSLRRTSSNASDDISASVSEMDKEHYEKLVFFHNQLAKQQEELASLGINIPLPVPPM